MTISITPHPQRTEHTSPQTSPTEQKDTGKTESGHSSISLAQKTDASVSGQSIAASRRKTPSVLPDQKPGMHTELAQEILKVSDVIKLQSPTMVKVKETSDLVKDMVKLLSRGLTEDDPINLSVFDKGSVVNLSELSDVAKQVGLLVTEHDTDAPKNYPEKKSQDNALIDDLKNRGVTVERSDSDHGLLEKNHKLAFVGKELGKASQTVANFETSLYQKLRSSKTTLDQVNSSNVNTHYQDIEKTAGELANVLASRMPGADEFAIESKLRMLLNYSPILEKALANAAMYPLQAAFSSPAASTIKVQNALDAIDNLHQQLTDMLASQSDTAQIKQTLDQSVRDLVATGNVFGKMSSRIKENPSSNNNLTDISDQTLAHWLAKDNDLEFTQPVIMGTVNPSNDRHTVGKQPMLDNLIKALGIDTSSVPADTPVVIKMIGDNEQFTENTVEPFRDKLLVNAQVDVIKAGETIDQKKTIDLKQAPLIQSLENIITGDYSKVHPELLDMIDNAEFFEVSSSKNPEFAKELQDKFHDTSNTTAQTLKRTMAARLLIPALSLEGTSVSETASNLAGPTLVGLGMDVGKNFIPDSLGILKTALVQTFFLGVDAADNLAGAWPEVQSLLETMGVKNVDYEAVFGEPAPVTNAAKAKEFMKLTLGLRGAEGEAGPAVATGLRSAMIGTVIGNTLTTGYSIGIGALDLNPALRAAVSIPAIVGTSLGIAINFAVNHSDLSLAYKKQIDDGTLGLPDNVDRNNAADLNKYCSDIAKRQLMLLSGTGPAAKAFTFAPLAGLSQLLGYVIPTAVVEAAVTPLMPGMENIVRLVAMSKHNDNVENAMDKVSEKALSAAAEGKPGIIDKQELDNLLFSKTDHLTADITQMVGGLLTGLLGRRGYHEMQIASGNTSAPANTGLTDAQVEQITQMSQIAAQNLREETA